MHDPKLVAKGKGWKLYGGYQVGKEPAYYVEYSNQNAGGLKGLIREKDLEESQTILKKIKKAIKRAKETPVYAVKITIEPKAETDFTEAGWASKFNHIHQFTQDKGERLETASRETALSAAWGHRALGRKAKLIRV